MSFDVSVLKKDFPLLSREENSEPLIYLDSAATSQKPQKVLDVVDSYYREINANVHRGAYRLAEQATTAMEDAREKVSNFIKSDRSEEIIFTKNATESINLVARSWGESNLQEGDVVLVSSLEHHANIVPWHQLAESRGIEVRWIPLTESGLFDLTDLDHLLHGVKLVAVSGASNVLGTVPPVRMLADAAHNVGALCLVDASQYVPHRPTDLDELGCDFLAFTGHKMCGPTGIGVLWGRSELLENMPAFLGGGEMILDVTKEGFTTNTIPWKFEAGTPPIAEIVGLGAAIDYLESIGMENVLDHEKTLTSYALQTLSDRFGNDLIIHGPNDVSLRGGVLSMCYQDIHPHDVSQILDSHGVCVRAGHHCAKPLMKLLDVNATVRASLYLYNDESDVDALADALEATGQFFSP
ncbi:MAG: Cysteine desulfurase SufS [Acidimicrobiales bacterium AG-410-I20]|nr:MAG: Cysteine desulfurase SufS [Acidimicrobiales bacterium AG-410-I20]